MSVAALVLGIVGLFACFLFVPSILAVIFGLVARRQIRDSYGAITGAGKARAGWILGLVGIAIGATFVALVSTGVIDTDDHPDDLEVGQCVRIDLEDEIVSSVPTVECSQRHNGEVMAHLDLDAGDGSWPGDDVVGTDALLGCAGDVFEDYVGRAYDESEFDVYVVYPSKSTWSRGDRTATCFVVSIDGSDYVGRARASGR